ncbi:hypothetical protein ACTMU2_12125 [Cupriavidus basilensis]
MHKPLRHVRVLDLTNVLAGPSAATSSRTWAPRSSRWKRPAPATWRASLAPMPS